MVGERDLYLLFVIHFTCTYAFDIIDMQVVVWYHLAQGDVPAGIHHSFYVCVAHVVLGSPYFARNQFAGW